MEKLTKIKSLQSTSIDSSFEEEISEINSEFQKGAESETSKKYLEDFSLDEIYTFVDEIDNNNSTDLNSIFTNEKKNKIFPCKNDNENNNECKEILDIFKKRSPFKSLKEPIKVSLIGKVFINDTNNFVINKN